MALVALHGKSQLRAVHSLPIGLLELSKKLTRHLYLFLPNVISDYRTFQRLLT